MIAKKEAAEGVSAGSWQSSTWKYMLAGKYKRVLEVIRFRERKVQCPLLERSAPRGYEHIEVTTYGNGNEEQEYAEY